MAKGNNRSASGQGNRKASQPAAGKRKGKKEKDGFDWKESHRPPAEQAKPVRGISGNFKSMKSMWMQTFAKEQEEASRKAALAQGPDDKEACTLSAVLPEHLPTAGDIPQQPLAAVEAAAPGDLLEPPGAAPHDSMPDSSGAAQPALTTQTRQQGTTKEALADAAAAVARHRAEAELADAAEARAKQHVEESTAKEESPRRSKTLTISPRQEEQGIQRRTKPAEPSQGPPKKRRREASSGSSTPGQLREPAPAGTQAANPGLVRERALEAGPPASPPAEHTRQVAQTGPQPKQEATRPALGPAHEQQQQQQQSPQQQGKARVKRQATGPPAQRRVEPDSASAALPNAEATGPHALAQGRREGAAEVSSPAQEAIGGAEGSHHPVRMAEAVVEYVDGAAASCPLGKMDLGKFQDRGQLMSAIRESWGSTLPAIVDLKMIYEDFDGDFLLLQPTELWPSIASHIRRLIICCR